MTNKMAAIFYYLLMLSFYISFAHSIYVDLKQFVNLKDMSEYCRRRVLSSYFLGHSVVQANAKVLHFTKLELPYNCFIAIRTESGDRIVSVIQLETEKAVLESCSERVGQLQIYELGETFGAYWGSIPKDIVDGRSVSKKLYTLEVPSILKETTTKLKHIETENNLPRFSESSPKSFYNKSEDDNYFTIEVPLLNVTAKLIVNDKPTKQESHSYDDVFDFMLDVTPNPREKYDTSIIPLLQISGRKIGTGYEMSDSFSGDPRNTANRRTLNTRRKISTKKSTNVINENNLLNKSVTSIKSLNQNNFTNVINSKLNYYNIMTTPTFTRRDNLKLKKHTVDFIFKPALHGNRFSKLGSTFAKAPFTIPTYSTVSFRRFHNFNLFTSKDNTKNTVTSDLNNIINKSKTTIFSTDNIETSITNSIKQLNNNEHVEKGENIGRGVDENLTTTTNNLQENVGNMLDLRTVYLKTISTQTTVSSTHNTKQTSVSLVDHESWENVVHIAPAIAEILNHTPSEADTNTTRMLNKTADRVKRRVNAIDIEKSRPHRLDVPKQIFKAIEHDIEISDLDDFVQNVEIEDDDLQGRVALRYLKNYLSPVPIYDICNQEVKTRSVVLLNASRIIIALSNFTLDRLTLVLTTSQVISKPHVGCKRDKIECQISGTRVCIDASSSCDGIPNCGAIDIYDEDRRVCNQRFLFGSNVGLAAGTLVAVLLTILYAAHYWLRRCVPKVSNAFFIYTDGTENVLFLDSIMRPPNSEIEKLVFQPNFFNGDIDIQVPKPTFRTKVLSLFKYFKRLEIKEETNFPEIFSEPKRVYSFTQLELSKMGPLASKDAGVQTGESLEMAYRPPLSVSEINTPLDNPYEYSNIFAQYPQSLLVHESFSSISQTSDIDELNIMRYAKKNRTASLQPLESRETNASRIEEREIRSMVYDQKPLGHHRRRSNLCDKTDVSVKPDNTKRLRFDDDTTVIQPADDAEFSVGSGRSVATVSTIQDLDTIEEDQEHGGPRLGRDFKRFWTGVKSKKLPTKKKTNVLSPK